MGGVSDPCVSVCSCGCLSRGAGEWERAARLCGVAAALREVIGVPPLPNWREEWERELGAARAALGEAAFAAVWTEGQALPLDTAIEYALKEAQR